MKTMQYYIQILCIFLFLNGCEANHKKNRQAEVAEVGKTVMPFDLDRSTHVFEKTRTGGVQRVVSDDQDAEQILLIQSHLAGISERFSAGDFHDPTQIHGQMMPGLHTLKIGYYKVNITYKPITNGGQISYVTDDETLILAIHQWFDAQVSDHGAHAQHH